MTLKRMPFSALGFLCSVFAYAQVYPTLTTVRINAAVHSGSPDGYFYYAYTITNDAQNAGWIESVLIDASRAPGSVSFDTSGLQFAGSSYLESNFRLRFPPLGTSMVPFGYVSLPENSYSILGNYAQVFVSKDTLFIRPGAKMQGLILMSRGLPGVRACSVEPYFNDDVLLPSLEDPSRTMTTDQMDSIRQACNFIGHTIGPWAPESEFRPLVFLDTLRSFVLKSRAFGWIASQTVAEKYLRQLDITRSQLQDANVKAGMTTLQTILQQSHLDSSSTLTSEAYALIRFNAEYLVDKIKSLQDR